MQEIDVYYESLKQLYDQIIHQTEEKPHLIERMVNWIVGITIVSFTLSLIPVIPLLSMYIAGRFELSLGPISFNQVTIGTFALVWLASTLASGAFLILALWTNSRINSSRKAHSESPQTLSPDQLTFIASYEAYKELKVFFVSHIEQHVENCRSAVIRILPSAQHRIETKELLEVRQLSPAEMEMEYRVEDPFVFRIGPASLSKQISVAQAFLQAFENYAWFQLDAKTKSTVQALVEFPEKIVYRLSKKEDLPSVLEILENLSKFMFAFLPEHKTYMSVSDLDVLQTEGIINLQRFVKQVNAMTSYPLPAESKTVSEVAEGWISKLQKSSYLPIFIQFAIWFVIILILTTGGVYLASTRFTLTPDSMATLIIGSSVAGAAALTAIRPKGGKQD